MSRALHNGTHFSRSVVQSSDSLCRPGRMRSRAERQARAWRGSVRSDCGRGFSPALRLHGEFGAAANRVPELGLNCSDCRLNVAPLVVMPQELFAVQAEVVESLGVQSAYCPGCALSKRDVGLALCLAIASKFAVLAYCRSAEISDTSKFLAVASKSTGKSGLSFVQRRESPPLSRRGRSRRSSGALLPSRFPSARHRTGRTCGHTSDRSGWP